MTNITPNVTTEPVAPNWRRLLSRLIDAGGLAAVLAITVFLASKVGGTAVSAGNALMLSALLLYEVIIPTVTQGRSLGRLVLRLRLASEADRNPPSFLQCLVRSSTRLGLYAIIVVFVAYETDLLSIAVVACIEAAFMVLSKQRQTLGDFTARTVVVAFAGTAENAA